MEKSEKHHKRASESIRKLFRFNYDKTYKILLLVPILLLLFSLTYLYIFYSKNGDFIYKDVSLSGGTSITLNGEIDLSKLEGPLNERFSDVSFTTLEDITSKREIALIIETSSSPEELTSALEEILGYKLTEQNSSVEFTGAALSQDFYRQLIIAMLMSLALMSTVIFILFRMLAPSVTVVLSVIADIIVPLALINFLEVKLSAAGIAAFLMIIGYAVDGEILLTSRVMKSLDGGPLNSRIFGAFKTGFLMNLTALAAVIPAIFIVKGLPDSFTQIFLILSLGLGVDIINTWLGSASVIKWECDNKGIK